MRSSSTVLVLLAVVPLLSGCLEGPADAGDLSGPGLPSLPRGLLRDEAGAALPLLLEARLGLP